MQSVVEPPTRWGICGAGKSSQDFINAMRLLVPEEHQVVAVAARDKQRALFFAQSLNIPFTCTSYEELSLRTDIDIIYVATVNSTHYSLCKLMIEAGKNVLCEKPMCLNARQCNKLIELAQQNNVFFMEGLWSRFFPIYSELRHAIETKMIGEVVTAYIPVGFKISDKERISQKSLGGGVVLDLSTYAIQLALWIFKMKPSKVLASGCLNEEGVDVYNSIQLHFEDGRMATLHANGLLALDNTAILIGTDGYLQIPCCTKPTTLITAKETINIALPTISHETFTKRSEGFVYEIQAVRRCLINGEKQCATVPHSESLLISCIMDEARKQMNIVFPDDTSDQY